MTHFKGQCEVAFCFMPIKKISTDNKHSHSGSAGRHDKCRDLVNSSGRQLLENKQALKFLVDGQASQ